MLSKLPLLFTYEEDSPLLFYFWLPSSYWWPATFIICYMLQRSINNHLKLLFILLKTNPFIHQIFLSISPPTLHPQSLIPFISTYNFSLAQVFLFLINGLAFCNSSLNIGFQEEYVILLSCLLQWFSYLFATILFKISMSFCQLTYFRTLLLLAEDILPGLV